MQKKKLQRRWRHGPNPTISQNRGGGGVGGVAYKDQARPPPRGWVAETVGDHGKCKGNHDTLAQPGVEIQLRPQLPKVCRCQKRGHPCIRLDHPLQFSEEPGLFALSQAVASNAQQPQGYGAGQL